MQRVLIQLPSDICDDLLESDENVQLHYGAPRGDAASIIRLVVDTVNQGTAVVSLVVAGNHLRKLARALLRRQEASPSSPAFQVSLTSGKKSLRIESSADLSEDSLTELITQFVKEQA